LNHSEDGDSKVHINVRRHNREDQGLKTSNLVSYVINGFMKKRFAQYIDRAYLVKLKQSGLQNRVEGGFRKYCLMYNGN